VALLETHGLTARYGDFQALYGIDLELREGETLAIIGANGAGKSTFLKTIAGLLPANLDSILFDGQPIGGLPAAQVVRLGISLVPEGRRLFPSLSLEENLLIGAYGRRQSGYWSLQRIYDLFPALVPRRHAPSQALSGGEQQMTAIGRALMALPRILLLDEPSLGLAPVVVGAIFDNLVTINRTGTTVLLVEQNVLRALRLCARAYVLENGTITLAGTRDALLADEAIKRAYLGY